MLSALCALRRIILHPESESADTHSDFVSVSARLTLLVFVLCLLPLTISHTIAAF